MTKILPGFVNEDAVRNRSRALLIQAQPDLAGIVAVTKYLLPWKQKPDSTEFGLIVYPAYERVLTPAEVAALIEDTWIVPIDPSVMPVDLNA